MPIKQLMSIIDEQLMLRFIVIIDFIDYQFLSIINANRSVGERIQISNICVYCKMGIRTCWNVWDTEILLTPIDEFRELICDYRLVID